MNNQFYIIIPTEILQNRRLGPFAKILYGYIDFRQGKNDCCWQKEDTIALELTTTRATIQRATKQLEAEDELIVERSHGGLNQSNHYRLAHRYNARDSRSDENGASTRSAGGASNYGAKSQSGASNRSTKTNRAKTQRGKDKANISGNSFYESAEEKKMTVQLVETHADMCPAIPDRSTKPEEYEDAKKPLYRKVRDALREYGHDRVPAAIGYFSPKATQGDGWGPVIKSLRKGWTESKMREEAYEQNLARDQAMYPKQPRVEDERDRILREAKL